MWVLNPTVVKTGVPKWPGCGGKSAPASRPSFSPNPCPSEPQRLMYELQEALPPDTILFPDVGNSLAWAIHYMKFQVPGSFVAPLGMATMGYGVSAAIGGKLAAPHRPVVCLVGDGAFMMNGFEVATAVNYDAPVVWIVQNNCKLGMVHDLMTFTLGDRVPVTRFKRLDFVKIAEGLGAEGFRVEKPGELAQCRPGRWLPESLPSSTASSIPTKSLPSPRSSRGPDDSPSASRSCEWDRTIVYRRPGEIKNSVELMAFVDDFAAKSSVL